MSQGTIINILTTYDELFEQYSLISTVFRWIMMKCIMVLRSICNVLNDVYISTYELLDFTEYGPIQNLITEFRIFIYAALVISFLALGYLYILDKNNRPDWIKNAFIGLICVITIPTILGKLNDLTYQSSMMVLSWGNGSQNTSTVADSTIINNAYDLLYMVENGFYNNGDLSSKNAINSINAIDVEEVVTSEKVSGDNAKQLFGNEVVYNSVGVPTLNEIKKDTIFTISEPPYYYRWHIDFLPLLIQLIGVICAYLVCAWKVVQIVWELIADQLLIVLFSGDLTGGQRMKKLITYFLNLYVVMLLINVFIKIYQFAFDYVNTLSWGSLTKALIIAFISFCVAQGPNIVQQILGIDAGISNGFGKVYAASGIAKAAVAAAKAGAGIAGGVVGGAIGSAGEILKERPHDESGPVSDENKNTSSQKMEDVNNKKHDPYNTSDGSGKDEGIIFNESNPNKNNGMNPKQEDNKPNGKSSLPVSDGKNDGIVFNENRSNSSSGYGDKEANTNRGTLDYSGYGSSEGIYDSNGNINSESTTGPYDESGNGNNINASYGQDSSSGQEYSGSPSYEDDDSKMYSPHSDNRYQREEKINPFDENKAPKMRDLKNERKVILQEHREGMARAEQSRSGVVRSTKAGYQRGKTAVKIVRHGADLINERKNRRKGS